MGSYKLTESKIKALRARFGHDHRSPKIEDVIEAARLLCQGHSIHQIAKLMRTKIGHYSVSVIRDICGVKPKNPGMSENCFKASTLARIHQIMELKKQGYTYQKIGPMLGITASWASSTIKRLDYGTNKQKLRRLQKANAAIPKE